MHGGRNLATPVAGTRLAGAVVAAAGNQPAVGRHVAGVHRLAVRLQSGWLGGALARGGDHPAAQRPVRAGGQERPAVWQEAESSHLAHVAGEHERRRRLGQRRVQPPQAHVHVLAAARQHRGGDGREGAREHVALVAAAQRAQRQRQAADAHPAGVLRRAGPPRFASPAAPQPALSFSQCECKAGTIEITYIALTHSGTVRRTDEAALRRAQKTFVGRCLPCRPPRMMAAWARGR